MLQTQAGTIGTNFAVDSEGMTYKKVMDLTSWEALLGHATRDKSQARILKSFLMGDPWPFGVQNDGLNRVSNMHIFKNKAGRKPMVHLPKLTWIPGQCSQSQSKNKRLYLTETKESVKLQT